MPITEKAILDALSHIQDPNLNRDIVSLGFIKNLRIEESTVSFNLELITHANPHQEALRNQCIEQIKSLGVDQVEVNPTVKVRSAPTDKRPIPGVRNLIAVASGKGGVGKSTVSMNLAIALAQSGAKTGFADCDIYGPSAPAMIGNHKRVEATPEQKLIPHEAHGLKVMSMGFMVAPSQSISWRGPMLHKMLQHFLFGTEWGELDYLIVDMPPGTGDVQLTLTGSTPLTAAVLVTTPQDVALRDVQKGLEMFKQVKIPVLGVVENMSYYACPKCDKQYRIFGQGGAAKMAENYQIPMLGEIPLHRDLPSVFGKGEPLMARQEDHPAKPVFRDLAEKVVTEHSRLIDQWAKPSPNAWEV